MACKGQSIVLPALARLDPDWLVRNAREVVPRLWRSNGSSRTATPSGSMSLQSMALTGSDAAYGRLESGHSASTIIYNHRPNG